MIHPTGWLTFNAYLTFVANTSAASQCRGTLAGLSVQLWQFNCTPGVLQRVVTPCIAVHVLAASRRHLECAPGTDATHVWRYLSLCQSGKWSSSTMLPGAPRSWRGEGDALSTAKVVAP